MDTKLSGSPPISPLSRLKNASCPSRGRVFSSFICFLFSHPFPTFCFFSELSIDVHFSDSPPFILILSEPASHPTLRFIHQSIFMQTKQTQLSSSERGAEAAGRILAGGLKLPSVLFFSLSFPPTPSRSSLCLFSFVSTTSPLPLLKLIHIIELLPFNILHPSHFDCFARERDQSRARTHAHEDSNSTEALYVIMIIWRLKQCVACAILSQAAGRSLQARGERRRRRLQARRKRWHRRRRDRFVLLCVLRVVRARGDGVQQRGASLRRGSDGGGGVRQEVGERGHGRTRLIELEVSRRCCCG